MNPAMTDNTDDIVESLPHADTQFWLPFVAVFAIVLAVLALGSLVGCQSSTQITPSTSTASSTVSKIRVTSKASPQPVKGNTTTTRVRVVLPPTQSDRAPNNAPEPEVSP